MISGEVVDSDCGEQLLSWSALSVVSQTLSLVLTNVEVLLTMAASPQPMPSNFRIVIFGSTPSSLAPAAAAVLSIGWKIPPFSMNQSRNNSPVDFFAIGFGAFVG